MQSRSLSRELALLMLGQVSDRVAATAPPAEPSLESLLMQALNSLQQHVRDALDHSAADLQQAQQELLDSELQGEGEQRLPRVREHLRAGLSQAEQALNRLSASLELPRLLLLQIRRIFLRMLIPSHSNPLLTLPIRLPRCRL